jgi:DNA-binding LytR/AlgR family response regulator
MYQIAICEDEQVFSEEHEKACRAIFDKLNTKCKTSVFPSGEEFLVSFEQHGMQYDLILLDIGMDGIDGMTLARKIRQANEDVDIVFITSNQAYISQGYDVKALHYLMKPVDMQKLERLIIEAYKKKFDDNVYIIKSGEQSIRVPVKDIVYLETEKRKVNILRLNGNSLEYSGKLKDILCGLSEWPIIRCHESFAINITNIRELITRQKAIAVNGTEIPISRKYWDDVKDAFMRQMDDG